MSGKAGHEHVERPNRMNPVVVTSADKVRGTIQDGIACFRGIPFAAPPEDP